MIEQTDGDPKQKWAVRMDKFLRKLHVTVAHACQASLHQFDPEQLTRITAAYQQIITLGHRTNPAETVKTGKRGVIRQTPARNLRVRLDRD